MSIEYQQLNRYRVYVQTSYPKYNFLLSDSSSINWKILHNAMNTDPFLTLAMDRFWSFVFTQVKQWPSLQFIELYVWKLWRWIFHCCWPPPPGPYFITVFPFSLMACGGWLGPWVKMVLHNYDTCMCTFSSSDQFYNTELEAPEEVEYSIKCVEPQKTSIYVYRFYKMF